MTGDDVAACFLIGGERTLIQDPGFVFRQLVDVAIRALSPAVNDPTTGVQAIDRMVDLLATVAARPDPPGRYVDDRSRRGAFIVPSRKWRLVDLIHRGHPLARTVPDRRLTRHSIWGLAHPTSSPRSRSCAAPQQTEVSHARRLRPGQSRTAGTR
jgi:hypothetical protein